MTWACDQRIAYIKAQIEAGESVVRAEVAAKFNCTIQTVSATFRATEARYPALMVYDASAKAYRRPDLANVPGLSWRDRALAAETEAAQWKAAAGEAHLRAGRLAEALRDAIESLEITFKGNFHGWECSRDELLSEARAALLPEGDQGGERT